MKPISKTIYESYLEDDLNRLYALGGEKVVLKYLSVCNPVILSINPYFHESMNNYLKEIKKYYKKLGSRKVRKK